MSGTCLHLGASSVGYTQAPIQEPDPSVAGMALFAGVFTCHQCGDLVVGVSLHPKSGGPPTLHTRLVPLTAPKGGAA